MTDSVASLVARGLILAARDEHVSFDERRHPNPVLLRALSRYHRRLVARIVKVNTKFMVETIETAFPLGDFDAGIALPDYKFPIGAEVELSNAPTKRTPVDLVPWESRHRYGLAAYVRNNTLYLTGTTTDWLGFTLLRFFYMPDVTTLTRLTDTLIVPNAAEPCLVAHLAYVMAKRGHNDKDMEKPDRGEFQEDWLAAEEALMDELTQQGQAETSVVRETF